MTDKPEPFTVVSSNMLTDNCIEIIGRGPSRSHRCLTVHFDRRGNITHGYLHEPAYAQAYFRPEQIPEKAKAEALKMYAANKRS